MIMKTAAIAKTVMRRIQPAKAGKIAETAMRAYNLGMSRRGMA